MKHPTNIQPSSAKATEGGHPTSIVLALLLMAASALALPQPIRNGVLTGTLNANRQAVTNVGTLTFTDGTTLNTAAVGGTVNTNAFTGTVTNLAPSTVAYSTNTFIQVSGSGLAPVNDNTYATNASFGSAYGYPIYVNASQTEQIVFWEAAPFGLQSGQSGWIIATNGFDQNGNTPVYYLSEGVVASPDLATNWISVLADGGGNLNPNPINNPSPAVVSVVTVSTNLVRYFNIATFTNGVCVTNLSEAEAEAPAAANGLAISNAPNSMVILSGNGLPGSPLSVAANTQIGALLYDEAEAPGGILLFDP